ncbi:alpha/beta fold hydrolase [Williamsia soli]|uniref:alpha/beta fold hydrolase n=1 Tax=Williamsia soli TaxID=364929 RepID=UPI001A9DA626|nr:alpha/beta hydrolase [Williamsia soli]
MNESRTPAWLLLHGVPLTPAVWAPLVQRLPAAFAADAIMPTMIATESSPDVQAGLAGELVRRHRQDARRLHVVGHSFGGQVALEFALQAPASVASLTLLCTRDTPFPAFARLAETVRNSPIDPSQSIQRWFNTAEIEANGPAVRYARATLERADRTQWSAALTAISRFDCSERTGQITAPTTVIAADRDPVSSVSAMGEMADRIVDARMSVLADAGHMSPFSDPERLADLLLASARRA